MKNNNSKNLHMAFYLMALLLVASPVVADDDDQEIAREALSKGIIRPLSELLEKIETIYSGHVLEVELESEDSHDFYDSHDFGDDENGKILIYEIKLLTPQGNVVKLKFDAKNLKLLIADGRDLDKARKHDDEND